MQLIISSSKGRLGNWALFLSLGLRPVFNSGVLSKDEICRFERYMTLDTE